jgi:uncharacterized protein (TIGR03083 family)
VDLTASAPNGNGLTDLVVDALIASETEPAPPALRQRVLAAAQAQRAPGRPTDTAPISPVEGYLRTGAELDDLLASLDAADWDALVEPYNWTVQGLVGHLLAIERLLGTRLGVDDFEAAADLEADHIAVSLETVNGQAGRDPATTLTDWRLAARRVRDALEAGVDLEARVPFHGVNYRWSSLLAARTLEVWTHADDIRRATGRDLVAPDGERLALLTDLAVRTLPLRLALTGGAEAPVGTIRVVLTGPGGGAWQESLGSGAGADESGPQVRIVADAVAFCRLSAGRLAASELGATIEGDQDLAAAVLVASAAFAV